MNEADLPLAVQLWTGWGIRPWPNRDDAAVLAEFGDAEGRRLLAHLVGLEAEFYQSNAYLTAPNLAAMSQQAAQEFQSRHPALDSTVATAFAWCYTFDHR